MKDMNICLKIIIVRRYMILYKNNKSDNVHFITRLLMKYKYIKAAHSIIQRNMNEKYLMNFNQVIDSSVGIRTILCNKQIEVTHGKKKAISSFTDDFYYPEAMEKFINKDFDLARMNIKTRLNLIAEHSLYNQKYPVLSKDKIPSEMILFSYKNNRFNLSESKKEKLISVFNYDNKKLKKEGFINEPLREMNKDDIKDILFNESGKQVKFTIQKMRQFLNIISPKICDTTKGFFWMLRKFKAFAIISSIKSQDSKTLVDYEDDENGFENICKKTEDSFYHILDRFLVKAKNYDEDNNKILYEKQTKLDFDIICIPKMAKRTSLSKYLKVCNISYFEYCKYKAEKIKLDIPDIIYNEYCGRTKEFSDEMGCEIIQANMGMGKTAMCEKYLEKHNDKSVLIVTCKRTLANNFKQRFPDFIDYRDIDGKIREEKVIYLSIRVYT